MNLILDIDGTLWNTTDIVAIAWNDAIEAVGLGEEIGRIISGPLLRKEFGRPMDTIINEIFASQDYDTRQTLYAKIREYEQAYLRKTDQNLTYPNVVDTIRKLSKKHRLFIVSNCQPGYIELVMEKLDIEDCITDFESFGNTGLEKAENIELIMNRNRFPANTTCYVGDTYGDYLSTVKVGIPFVFANYGFGQLPEGITADTISSFDELLSYELPSYID